MSNQDTTYIETGGLRVAANIHDLVVNEIAPGTGVEPAHFWQSLAAIVRDLGPKRRELLAKRDELQAQIDEWYRARKGQAMDVGEQKVFLTEIGYLVPEGPDFKISCDRVDDEIARIAGPQLVVPVQIARYALNAANARWGSLYDALYGTNVIAESGGTEKGSHYNPVRGAKVIEYAKAFLDEAVPLDSGAWGEVAGIELSEESSGSKSLRLGLNGGGETRLSDPAQFAGYNLKAERLSEVLLKNNGLHIVVKIDPENVIARDDPAGIKDVLLEAALTTIQDFEDSVCAVDAQDKELVYRNWYGLMKGSLTERFFKRGKAVTRQMTEDLSFTGPNGDALTLPGRSLLLVRNSAAHTTTDAVLTGDGAEVPEDFVDAMVSTLAAIHDLKGNGRFSNSRAGSIYIVKPKQHGPEEVASTVELFDRVEQALGLDKNTLKIGIMDEERRTTVNLKECIRASRERVMFVNTGFLDRTGDEIHTAMEAGPMVPKPDIKDAGWIAAYEDWNVDIGIECGLPGSAQIGKGMWPKPDDMNGMVETKIAHPSAGANTAWVPSPTAATLHAMHYHRKDVFAVQQQLAKRPRASLDAILMPPLLGSRELTAEVIQRELDNNAQSMLGYMVRWVGQGVGCSKVPDINDVALMEDRATLRISAQHITNWLYHGIVSREQLIETMQRMAQVVDRQNADHVGYRAMSTDLDASIEFQAALDMIFKGRDEPNGYTEWILRARRREVKAAHTG